MLQKAGMFLFSEVSSLLSVSDIVAKQDLSGYVVTGMPLDERSPRKLPFQESLTVSPAYCY